MLDYRYKQSPLPIFFIKSSPPIAELAGLVMPCVYSYICIYVRWTARWTIPSHLMTQH